MGQVHASLLLGVHKPDQFPDSRMIGRIRQTWVRHLRRGQVHAGLLLGAHEADQDLRDAGGVQVRDQPPQEVPPLLQGRQSAIHINAVLQARHTAANGQAAYAQQRTGTCMAHIAHTSLQEAAEYMPVALNAACCQVETGVPLSRIAQLRQVPEGRP